MLVYAKKAFFKRHFNQFWYGNNEQTDAIMHDQYGPEPKLSYGDQCKVFVLNLGWTKAKLANYPRSMLLRSNKLVCHPCLDDDFVGAQWIPDDLYDRFVSFIPVVYKKIEVTDLEEEYEDGYEDPEKTVKIMDIESDLEEDVTSMQMDED